MLMEGVPPAMIENAARMAGMPVGPLALNDEVGVDLSLAHPAGDGEGPRRQRHRPGAEEADRDDGREGPAFRPQERQGLLRLSRQRAKEPVARRLAAIVGKTVDPDTISVKDLKDRFLFTAALEAARCLFEGVVTDPREADVGSILGFGYAPYTGGTISFIDGMGLKSVRRAREGTRRDLRLALRAAGKARADGREGRDFLRNLRREAEGRVGLL